MKRITALKALSIDHHHGLVLARKARLAAIAEDAQHTEQQQIWSQLLAHAKTVLLSHFEIEEVHIAAALSTLNDPHVDRLVNRLYHEHAALRELLSAETAQTAANLKQLGELLEQHIRFEEREFFEVAQTRLNPQTLQAIATACKTR